MTNIEDSSTDDSSQGSRERGEASPPSEGVQAPAPDGVEQFDSGALQTLDPLTGQSEPAVSNDFDEAGLFGPQDDIFRRKVIRPVATRRGPATHLDQVRARLALGILAGLFILYLMLFAAAIWGGMDMQMVQILATILSGPQALAAAAVGFYYATKDRQAKKSAT